MTQNIFVSAAIFPQVDPQLNLSSVYGLFRQIILLTLQLLVGIQQLKCKNCMYTELQLSV